MRKKEGIVKEDPMRSEDITAEARKMSIKDRVRKKRWSW